MPIKHDQPLHHRKRLCPPGQRLRRPVKDSAMKRTASCSFAGRHTTERALQQHYIYRRANLCSLLTFLFISSDMKFR